MKRRWMQQLLLVGFLLGIYHGRIAVWRAPDPEPVKVFPYYAAILPSQMRAEGAAGGAGYRSVCAGGKYGAVSTSLLILSGFDSTMMVTKIPKGETIMADNYGSDFMTIMDEDGSEFELEVLYTLEYNGASYLAVVPAVDADEEVDLEVSILKSVEEDGEPILCAIEDEQELETVYNLIMDHLYEDEEDEE